MISFQSPRSLSSLLTGLQCTQVHSPGQQSLSELIISVVTADSRQVVPGALFVAVAGQTVDGHDFIEDAVNRGCVAIVCMEGRLKPDQVGNLPVALVEVTDSAGAYATLAASYYGWPAEKMRFVGVTGTNGKTTVTYLLEHILLEAGYNVGVIGTVTNRYTTRSGGKKTVPALLTTPDALRLQQLLAEMVASGVDYVIMEVSSHGLAQSRVNTLFFDAAAFTNLSRDHLDYHRDMDEYFACKLRLFTDHMKSSATVVLPQVEVAPENRHRVESLNESCRHHRLKTLSWGREGGAAIRLLSSSLTLSTIEMDIGTATGNHNLTSPLVGSFNIENLLTAYGLGLALRVDEATICRALTTATGAPGRVERIVAPGDGSEGPVVLVDYAHTPDALEKVLRTVGALPHGRLFCVFGCGGDRDKGKRRLMGDIGARLSDVAIVTDDNPRSEDPDSIVAEILAGTGNGPEGTRSLEWLEGGDLTGGGTVIIRDRRKAIATAIRAAAAGDIVVIAGKGHEPYQLTRQGKRFFDDRLEARRTLCSWTVEQVVQAVDGRVAAGSTSSQLLGEVVTDSRLEKKKTIFVALKGDTHDAHLFAPQAVVNGAACLVVEREITPPPHTSPCQIVVQDSQKALGDLAAFRRRRMAQLGAQVVIGLTGSCGKTTVKEMTAAILQRKWPAGERFPDNCVLKTKGNFNNLIGLPLSLLPLDVHHRAAVLEMGMNQPGELSRLGEIADPDISCITNIHGAHLEGLQSIAGVARAKEELFAATRNSSTLVVNLDDKLVTEAAAKYTNPKITYATAPDSHREKPDVWASGVMLAKQGTLSFTLHHCDRSVDIVLQIAGEHNVSNGLCAAAICLAAGADLEEIKAGLADFRPPDKRMEMLQAGAGFRLLNDTYNANPASLAAGLKTLRQMAGRNAVAVIGDMLELGDSAAAAHYNIGRLLAELNIDYVGVVGEFRGEVKRGALEHGFDVQAMKIFADKNDVSLWINELTRQNKLGQEDVVLVKASRGLRFETIVAKILA